MADTWDEGTAGLLLSDAPPLIAETPAKAEEAGQAAPQVQEVQGRRGPCGPRPTTPSPGSRSTCRWRTSTARLTTSSRERLADQARPGVRVRVRFAGKLTDGFLIERAADSEHQGSLRYLERVVSAEQVLTEEIAGLARAVADRYAGTLADVLRLAVPQRHAATEAASAKAARARAARHGPAPAPGSRPLGQVPGGTVVPQRARRGPPGPRGLDGAARPGLAGGDRPGRRHHRERRPRRGHRGPRRA